jgi:hypothetical protein
MQFGGRYERGALYQTTALLRSSDSRRFSPEATRGFDGTLVPTSMYGLWFGRFKWDATLRMGDDVRPDKATVNYSWRFAQLYEVKLFQCRTNSLGCLNAVFPVSRGRVSEVRQPSLGHHRYLAMEQPKDPALAHVMIVARKSQGTQAESTI